MKKFIYITLLFIAFSALIKLPVLKYSHTEPDELIYWQLAENLIKTGHYTLQGTQILSQLSPNMYDYPLFHYPPLFPVLLVPFVLFGLPKLAILISWLGHFLCIAGVAIFGRYIVLEKSSSSPLSPAFWVPLLAISVDPFMTFISRKLWIDSIMSGLIVFSIALAYAGTKKEKPENFFLVSGLIFGLSVLLKPQALIAFPLFAYLLVGMGYKIRNILFFGLPVLFLNLPWFIIFYMEYGVFFASWIKPDEWLLNHSSFIRTAVERPFYYYIKEIILIQPLIVLCAVYYLRLKSKLTKPELIFPVFWFFLYIFVFSFLGVLNYGFQMRHIGPSYAGIYVIMYSIFNNSDEQPSFFIILGVLFIVYAAMSGGVFIFSPNTDEISGMLQILGVIK